MTSTLFSFTEENMELERRMAAVLDENWQPPTSPGAESHIGESVTSFTNSSDSDPGVETAGEGGDRAGRLFMNTTPSYHLFQV